MFTRNLLQVSIFICIVKIHTVTNFPEKYYENLKIIPYTSFGFLFNLFILVYIYLFYFKKCLKINEYKKKNIYSIYSFSNSYEKFVQRNILISMNPKEKEFINISYCNSVYTEQLLSRQELSF